MAASINPATLFLSAQLFGKLPLAGGIKLAGISGSLIDGRGATAQFNVKVASGSITLFAKKNGKNHDLYVTYSLKVSLVGDIKGSNVLLATLP